MHGSGSRVAVVGSGVAGLGSAWYLAPSHDVHVFERASRLGGHTHTHRVTTDEGPRTLDTGFIVYNEVTYPHLTRLLGELEVDSQPTNMSFSLRCERCDLLYSGLGPSGVFAQRGNIVSPSYLGFLARIHRFHSEGRSSNGALAGRTLAEFVEGSTDSPDLGRHYVYPLASALWSTGIDDVRRLPAETFTDFFKSHHLFQVRGRLQWRSLKNGSDSYITAMMRRLDGRTHTNTSVRAVERRRSGCRLHFGDGTSQEFDYVIMATHADEALRLMITPSDSERDLLGSWQYAESNTWLHSDGSFLPSRPAARASWNYHLDDCREPPSRTTMSYNLNRLQSLDTETPFLVTLNPDRTPHSVHAQMTYRHPIFTNESVASQDAIRDLNGRDRTYLCGAYLGYGFHEDGLRAGVEVARHFDARVVA